MTQSRSLISLTALLLALAATAVWGQCPQDGGTQSAKAPKCRAEVGPLPATAECPSACTKDQVSTQQVQIEVTIAKVDRTAARLVYSGAPETEFCVLKLLSTLDREYCALALKTLSEIGHATLLAEPRLVTMSGHQVSFMSGGEQAVPLVSGRGAVSVQFEGFHTRVSFLPVVLDKGKIHLEVEPEVIRQASDFSSIIQGDLVPGRSAQRVHATANLEDSQSLLIGGLAQVEVVGETRRVPVISDIPFLGSAFSTKLFKEVESELVILVTPHVVGPIGIVPPAPRYLQHPPQYIAPSPIFPLSRELAAMEAQQTQLLPGVPDAAPPLPPLTRVCLPAPCQLPPPPMPAPAIVAPGPISAPACGPCAAAPFPCPLPPPGFWQDPTRPLAPPGVQEPARPSSHLRTWRVASHDGKDYLVLRCGGTGCMACESMVLTSVGGKPVTLGIKGKQVSVTGPHFEAMADRLILSERDDEYILRGHVQGRAHAEGAMTDIKAERAVIGLTDGALNVKSMLVKPDAKKDGTTAPREQVGSWTIGIGR